MRRSWRHAPVVARMENLRRAAIYASADRQVAAALLAALRARISDGEAPARTSALALFDAGYLVETYRQASRVLAWNMLDTDTARRVRPSPGEDGYGLVQRALALAGGDPAMEYAASLMTTGETSAAHRRRAVAGAPAGSALPRNLAR